MEELELFFFKATTQFVEQIYVNERNSNFVHWMNLKVEELSNFKIQGRSRLGIT